MITPDAATMAEVEASLRHLRARCYVATKAERGGRWMAEGERASTFAEALALASRSNALEVAVFLDHAKYGGIQVWSSRCPGVANTFLHYEP